MQNKNGYFVLRFEEHFPSRIKIGRSMNMVFSPFLLNFANKHMLSPRSLDLDTNATGWLTTRIKQQLIRITVVSESFVLFAALSYF
jgi:hypothetical protein